MTSSPVLLVAANGGHLAQLWPPRPWWHGHERFWITLRTADLAARQPPEPDARPRHPLLRRATALFRNTLTAIRLFSRYRPAVVVSTGARDTLPFLVLARIRGVPTLPVEIHDRVTTPTRTALLCRPSPGRLPVRNRHRRRHDAASGPRPAQPRR
ncbi:hypothetical protein NI17_022795 [Thermobifida halotolerans]|uniref:Polysaccharide biosynthesis protein n=1 Tax=Thermobifida halotolerans TaxID=483545 RepID=A0AA97M3T5_9ACTN|nr:hypothetical protein [Thermobifida halotolerans]UOE19508.1 hypothetical protein NI17_022795 [Thermobifida halotolerans]